MSSKAASKTTYSAWRSFGVPLLGFGVGWGAYTALENSSYMNEATVQWTHLQNLRAQQFLTAIVPNTVSSKLFLSSEELSSRIAVLESVLAGDAPTKEERVPFAKILRECRVEEQLEWLEEQVEEEIPYFFIADLFHSWAEIHEHVYATTREADTAYAGVPDKTFKSTDLCVGVWKHTVTGVLPFDVGVRALAILAARNRDNAKTIASFHDETGTTAPQLLLKLYRSYATDMGDKKENVVSRDLVDAATAKLYLVLNAANQKRSLLLPWRRGPPFPLAEKSLVDSVEWCQCLGTTEVAVSTASLLSPKDVQSFQQLRDNGFRCGQTA